MAAVSGVDSVFHCAGIIHARHAADFTAINVRGTEHMLAASLTAGIRRFIYISSDEAAGLNRDRCVLMTEQDEPSPVSAYGRSKLLAEQAVDRYYRQFGLPTTIIRPSMLYGPGQHERIARLMRQVQRRRVPIFGDGQTRRSMTYIDNLIEGLLRAERSIEAVGQVYFMADRQIYTLIEILEAIAEALHTPLRILRLPRVLAQGCTVADLVAARLGIDWMELHAIAESIRDRACSIAKAERELGYAPEVDLREGMRRAVEWSRATGQL